MARIRYYPLGPTRQLNEIVVAGSHDAGITGGADNVQTQHLDILGQALAGVRVFDIRIKAVGDKRHPVLKTYHGAAKDPGKNSIRGATGEGLTKILSDARNFVTNPKFQNEFLILKFDKCSNWSQIASACVNLLGQGPTGTLFQQTGNLNTKTLHDLRGKVVVLFTKEGYDEVKVQYPPGSGILCVRSIAAHPYDGANFHGMQYCGKGGTNWKSGGSDTAKIAENYEKQRGLMMQGLGGRSDPDVMGMLYWTTTGFTKSIRARNDSMWNVAPGELPPALKLLFKSGLKESIQDRIHKTIDPTTYAAGTILKVFMPNIVMIDFSDRDKCTAIYDLNRVTGNQLVKGFQAAAQEVQQFNALMQQATMRGGRVKI